MEHRKLSRKENLEEGIKSPDLNEPVSDKLIDKILLPGQEATP